MNIFVLTPCDLYVSKFFFPKKIAFDVSEFAVPLFKVVGTCVMTAIATALLKQASPIIR